MRILFDITHPAHVHLFKNAIWQLQKKGHDIQITTRSNEVTTNLLDLYHFDYINLGNHKKDIMGKVFGILERDSRLYYVSKKFKPDILVGGVGNLYVAHISRLIGKPSIIFDDTEHARIEHMLFEPFANVICTPSCYNKNLGVKQIRYNGYHEIAYLHPNYFSPNPEVLDEIRLDKNETFIILRFISWNASHDAGQHGLQNQIELVRKLENYGRVFITSDVGLNRGLEKNKIKISPDKLHDLLYYATLYIGEGATTASESAVLGTHAIFTNTLRLGYTDEEERKYDLVYNFSDKYTMESMAINKALELLENNNLRKDGKKKREMLLKDKIDVTAFMVKFIENYPEGYIKSLKLQ